MSVPSRLLAGAVCLAAALVLQPSLGFAQSTSAPEAQASPPPVPRKAPVPSRLNEQLPSWLRIRGEFRERLEGFDGAGFDARREDLYWLSRVRVGATVTPSSALSVHLQFQDARVAKKTVGTTATPFGAPFDLRLTHADVGRAAAPVMVRLGRQELVFGEQRLVGHVSWLNAARTFDGASVMLRSSGLSATLFATSVVRILDGEFDKSGHGNWFTGGYASTTTLLPRGTVEPYAFWRQDVDLLTETAARADLSQTTVGVRLAGRLPARLDYGVEMALQRGSLGTDDVRAWAGHWQLRETLPWPGMPKISGEYNYASGDANPADGIRGTFDQLYPTPHDKYGLADQIGWRNIHHARLGLEFTPVRGLPLTTNYHSWWLADSHDALYSAGGAPVARIPGGAINTHVGHELDVQVARTITPHLQLAAGYAYLFPGAFLKQATPGAAYRYPYVMATYAFLADR